MSSAVTALLLRRTLMNRGIGSIGGIGNIQIRNSIPRLLSNSSTDYSIVSNRCYASTAIVSFADSVDVSFNSKGNTNSTSNNDNIHQQRVSPFQEIFDTIRDGKTFLGTKEFQYPTIKYLKCGIPEHKLKYKTTTYGRLLEEPFVRSNEHRVILQIAIRHIPLSEIERQVLKEIVGNRLKDDTGILQLSSSQFGSRIENKRHVVSMLERAVESAKTLASRIVNEEEETVA
mmetsp:Transcript_25981/g.29178  ORF Transcript_25981/g.29178 Transcript_25981/m.29178 type:complete len:230 (+) Transcript_25981:101-790(+)